MNKVMFMGRLTRDPEVRYSQGANATAVARFTIAVDRRFRREGEPEGSFQEAGRPNGPCLLLRRRHQDLYGIPG